MSKRKGTEFERRVRKELESLGFFVTRSAGSFGVFDLIAVNKFAVIGIQCRTQFRMTKYEQVEMINAGLRYGIYPGLAYREKVSRRYETYVFDVLTLNRLPLNEFVSYVISQNMKGMGDDR